MKILFNDQVQYSNAPATLRSPALADKWVGTSITITLNSQQIINSIGIGYTDASFVTVNGTQLTIDSNGLYEIPEQTTNSLVISHDGSFIGRLGAGYGHFLGLGRAREPQFKTSSPQRFTRSNQSVPGAGGVGWREIDVDVRYKVTREVFDDFELAYNTQIMRNYPFFILFEKEFERFPWIRFYGVDELDYVFQSSVNRFLYSRKFTFRECY